MKHLKRRLHDGETLVGCFLNLGSSLTAEIMGRAGYDFAVIDLEHGTGNEADVLPQLQALEATDAGVIVRVESHARQRAHRVLDLGAEGIMFPRVDSGPEAAAAVAGLRYPPQGVRGVAAANRACSFGVTYREYMETAASTLLGVVQIESESALAAVDAIAAVDGADVLFVGPMDLTQRAIWFCTTLTIVLLTLVANGVLREEYLARAAELEATPQVAAAGTGNPPWHARFVRNVAPMGLFELGYVGLPCALVGGVFLIFLAPRVLPDRTDIVEQLGEQRREYLVEMLVQQDCPLIGSTVEDAGLRQLPGLFLIEIDRNGEVITPVTPQDIIHGHDRLLFTGVVSTIVDLEKIPGLVPAGDLSYEFHPTAQMHRHLTEVVLSPSSPLIGSTVREGNFRQAYNAAVVAVHRNGIRLASKIGDICLGAGDTLLLQTRTDFVTTRIATIETFTW